MISLMQPIHDRKGIPFKASSANQRRSIGDIGGGAGGGMIYTPGLFTWCSSFGTDHQGRNSLYEFINVTL